MVEQSSSPPNHSVYLKIGRDHGRKWLKAWFPLHVKCHDHDAKNKAIIWLSSHPHHRITLFTSKLVVIVVESGLKPGFHYTLNATTTMQKTK